MEEVLIAPCGMNCGICARYLADKYDVKSKGIRIPYCIGCRPLDRKCAFKKRCNLLLKGKAQYCYECKDFPCANLTKLDNRYTSNYRMSMIENLEYMKNNGIEEFLKKEEEKWKCPECGATISCHNGICFNCGLDKLKTKKRLYRW